MKKIILILIIICALLFFTGCESEEDRLNRRVRETEEQARDAVRDYNNTQKDIYEYEKYRSKFNN